ncbi:FecR family protein [Rhizobium sp. FKY42]|uniref:FecR family protein n=1 Tax=Rhizobium sp. FKY42 TaxID=2562310 RepID=UPI0010BFDA7E|nr:FecR family protein [Rhizobium sp. FKY42]
MPIKATSDSQKKRNREAADWLLRNSDPNQSPTERAHFEKWLARDPENCRTYSAAERLLGDASRVIEADPALKNIKVKPQNRTKPVSLTLAALAIATGLFFALDGPIRLQADVIAGTDEMPLVTLEDGSEVQLNASSAIAVDFTEKRRNIRLLRGQAFFQVAPVADRPFTVMAGLTRVTALGTAFDVRYGDADTEVTVTEHSVQVEFDAQGVNPVYVNKDQQVAYHYEKQERVISPIDGNLALAWRRGQIALDNAPLSYVIEEMNRHLKGKIVVADSALANRRVSGTIKIADTDSALAFVTTALGVRVTHIGPLIVISR